MPILPKNAESQQQLIRLLPLLVLFFLAVLLAAGVFNNPLTEPQKSRMVGYHINDFSVPSLTGPGQVSPALWKGKVVVVNVFASWCEGCNIEHPVLMRLAESRKVEVIGIAWKDDPEDTLEWLKEHGNPYHHIGADTEGDTTLKFGLSGAPETFIIDRNNIVAYNYKAPITDEVLDTVILPMVEHLQSNAPAPAR